MGDWFRDKYAEGAHRSRCCASCARWTRSRRSPCAELFGAPHASQAQLGMDAEPGRLLAFLASRFEAPALKRRIYKQVNDLVRDFLVEPLRHNWRPGGARHVAERSPSLIARLPRRNISGGRPRCLWHDPGHRPDRLRRRSSNRTGVPPAGADHQLFPLPQQELNSSRCGSRGTRSAPRHRGHGALRRPGRGKVFTRDFNQIPHAHITTTTARKSFRCAAAGRHRAVAA